MNKYSIYDPSVGAFREVDQERAIAFVKSALETKAKLEADGVEFEDEDES